MDYAEFEVGDFVEIGFGGGTVFGPLEEITDDYLVVGHLGFPVEDIEWIEYA